MYLTQCEIDDNFSFSILESVGHVISEDDAQIVLAGDMVDEDVRRVIVIPKENIVSIKMLYLK